MHSHLESYFVRFRNLLGPGNRRYIQIIMVLTRAFLQALGNENCQSNFDPVCNAEGSKSGFDSSMAINEFLFAHNIDNINLFKLLRYIEESNIIHKVDHFLLFTGYSSISLYPSLISFSFEDLWDLRYVDMDIN